MGSFCSYAQNFEDVMLWRALRHVERGFYIDVGAQDPVVDSVSLAFYEQGWRGVHVEPNARYAEMLREQRPDEEVMQVAVSDDEGIVSFHEIPGTGLSTLEEDIARRHAKHGFDSRKVTLATVRLDAILARYADRDVHWLKIDVEGSERRVLSSWKRALPRPKPWIVVVESTAPMTQKETADAWQPILLARGYKLAYFDGLNRFYVSKEHMDLLASFRCPPNVFDGFELSGTASSSFAARVKAEVAARESAQQVEAALRDDLAREHIRANGEITAERERAQAQIVEEQNRARAEVAAGRDLAQALVGDERNRAAAEVDAERERSQSILDAEREGAQALLGAERERAQALLADERHRAGTELAEDRRRWHAELEAERARVSGERATERAALEVARRGELDRAGAERAALEQRLLATAEALATSRTDATHKDAAIASLQADAHALQERIVDLEERNRDTALQATAAERHAAQLDSQLVGATAEVLHLREHYRQSEVRVSALDARLVAVQSAYDAIESSRSWRLMAPIRSVAWTARRSRESMRTVARTIASGSRQTTRRILRESSVFLHARPTLKKCVLYLLGPFPVMRERLRGLVQTPTPALEWPHAKLPPKSSVPSTLQATRSMASARLVADELRMKYITSLEERVDELERLVMGGSSGDAGAEVASDSTSPHGR